MSVGPSCSGARPPQLPPHRPTSLSHYHSENEWERRRKIVGEMSESLLLSLSAELAERGIRPRSSEGLALALNALHAAGGKILVVHEFPTWINN